MQRKEQAAEGGGGVNEEEEGEEDEKGDKGGQNGEEDKLSKTFPSPPTMIRKNSDFHTNKLKVIVA